MNTVKTIENLNMSESMKKRMMMLYTELQAKRKLKKSEDSWKDQIENKEEYRCDKCKALKYLG